MISYEFRANPIVTGHARDLRASIGDTSVHFEECEDLVRLLRQAGLNRKSI